MNNKERYHQLDQFYKEMNQKLVNKARREYQEAQRYNIGTLIIDDKPIPPFNPLNLPSIRK